MEALGGVGGEVGAFRAWVERIEAATPATNGVAVDGCVCFACKAPVICVRVAGAATPACARERGPTKTQEDPILGFLRAKSGHVGRCAAGMESRALGLVLLHATFKMEGVVVWVQPRPWPRHDVRGSWVSQKEVTRANAFESRMHIRSYRTTSW